MRHTPQTSGQPGVTTISGRPHLIKYLGGESRFVLWQKAPVMLGRSTGDVDEDSRQSGIKPIPVPQASKPGATAASDVDHAVVPQPGHAVFTENRKGVSFDKIFGPWTDGAARIIVIDSYIRKFHQARNVMELVEMLIRRKQPEDQVAVHLVTAPDEGNI